ncbi:hypothetical protein PIB30_089245, partial [Stylosanthes scabra]|nr:hypothetical protein [Stylosanthes scabra]
MRRELSNNNINKVDNGQPTPADDYDDYIDRVPSKANRFSPIEHGTPLLPYIPKPQPPSPDPI